MDGLTASESVSNAGDRRYANPHSVEPPRNALASKVERGPQDPILYEEIVSMMREQAKRIRELEQNLEELRGAGERGRRENRH